MSKDHDEYTLAVQEQHCVVCEYLEKCKLQDSETCASFTPINFGDWVNRLTDDQG